MTSIVKFVNLILAALLAGTSFGIWVGFNPAHYSAPTYIEQQQHLVQSLHTLMVSLVIVSTLVTLFSAFLQRKNKLSMIALLLAAAFFISCIFISRFGNLPIQQEMLTWTSDTLPSNWTSLRDQWWSLHIWRTIAELLALGLVTWASIRKSVA